MVGKGTQFTSQSLVDSPSTNDQMVNLHQTVAFVRNLK